MLYTAPFQYFTLSQYASISQITLAQATVKLGFQMEMLGLKSGKVLASTYRLHHSLDGLPQILEFWTE